MLNVAKISIIVVALLLLSACDKEVAPDEVKKNITSGIWRISYFAKAAAINYTLSNYTFTFNENGTVEAKEGSTKVYGTYTVSEDDNDAVLDIMLGHSSPLDQLNNDWQVSSSTATRLETENNDNGITYLTFEKK